jgi:hypothetical protein
MPPAHLVRSSEAGWDFSINAPRAHPLIRVLCVGLCSARPCFDVGAKPMPGLPFGRESLKSKRIRVQNVLDSLDNARPA